MVGFLISVLAEYRVPGVFDEYCLLYILVARVKSTNPLSLEAINTSITTGVEKRKMDQNADVKSKEELEDLKTHLLPQLLDSASQ